MRLLITGGLGFIGSHIARAAVDAGHEVVLFDALLPAVHSNGVVAVPAAVEFIHGDVTDQTSVAVALRGVSVVCHQAAMVGLGVDFLDAPDYVRHNDLGTATLLAAMTAANIDRLVLASSMVVYGEGAYLSPARESVRPAPRRESDLAAGQFEPRCPTTGLPLQPDLISEDAQLDPRNVYATTKVMQEHIAANWVRSTGGRVAALRYHNVYGPGMPKDTPYAGVAALFRSALARGEAPEVFEDGRQRRDFIHATDVATANLAALAWSGQAEQGSFRAFNVGSGEVHTIGEVAAALSAQAGGAAPRITGRYRLGDVRHVTASSARLRDELGWEPRVSFMEGMAEFATAPLRGDAVGVEP